MFLLTELFLVKIKRQFCSKEMYGDEIFRDKYEATSYVALSYSLEVEAKRTGGNF